MLARKAHAIRNPDLLSNWLHGVALRTARNAKIRLVRQRKNDEAAAMRQGSSSSTSIETVVQPAAQAALDRDDMDALHDEIARLPGSFRLPVLLCYFEGLTLDEAAQRLQWLPGTLRSRLARARDKLHRALRRRGVVLSGGGLAMILSPRLASAHISSALCDTTAKAAIQFTAGQAAGKALSTSVAALTREVLRSMLINKMRLVLLTLLVLGSTVTGAGYLAHSLAAKDEPNKAPAGQRPVTATLDTPKHAAPGRMFIVGRVLDPQGKPMPNATVMAYSAGRDSAQGVIGQAQCGGSGLFRIDAPRSSSARMERIGAAALAPGYGVGWVELDPDVENPIANISLRPEQVVQGRLFDLQGRPVRAVIISVSAIRRILHQGPDKRRDRLEGPFFLRSDANGRPGWPKPATTDAEGRFTIRGIGRNLLARLIVRDPRYAQQDFQIETDGNLESKQLTLALQPAQIITGRVTYADTGQPVSHASLQIGADKADGGRQFTSFQTDDTGRFRANPSPGDRFIVHADPPRGQPYLSVYKDFRWPKGSVEHAIDLVLPRGILVRGKVTEQGSGKPIAEARVIFNAHSRPDAKVTESSTSGLTADDGSYQLTVVPSPGHLGIQAASNDYVLQVIGYRQFFEGEPGGLCLYSHAFIACDPKPGRSDLEVNVELRRGLTVQGQVVGPDDRPEPDTWMISRVIQPPNGMRQSWRGDYHGNARDGRFEIHGLDPDAEVPVYFLQPDRKLGATVYFSRKSTAAGPVTVRLQPCITARARLVNSDRMPIAGFSARWLISMVVTPGSFNSKKARQEGLMVADVAGLPDVDPINHKQDPVADGQGQITFRALIPGATYRIIDRTPFRGPDGPQHRKDFTVEAGEMLELGDILIEKPAAMR